VDTYRGTQQGVLPLVRLFEKYRVPATFLFTLGPDNTGLCLRRRLWKLDFWRKAVRTRVPSLYGWRTLMYGTLVEAPYIGRSCEGIITAVRDAGFELGVHAYDHFLWQDCVHDWPVQEVKRQFDLALREFERIVGSKAQCAGAPGWQANVHSLEAYDEAELLYGSDCRGISPFFPRVEQQTFRTLQIPTTLPTLDELMGRMGMTEAAMADHYLEALKSPGAAHVMTVHAEIEGLSRLAFFEALLVRAKAQGVSFFSLRDYAHSLLAQCDEVPCCLVAPGKVEGRWGTVLCQGMFV
jgi:peptidoglycan/xylan/chitin deacetylase (PgdA/CDA1 family)